MAADGSDRDLGSLSVRANEGAITDGSDVDDEWGGGLGATGLSDHLRLSLNTDADVDMAAFDSTDDEDDGAMDTDGFGDDEGGDDEEGDLIADDADLSGSVLLALQAEDEEQGGFDSLLDGTGLLGPDAGAPFDGVLHMGGDTLLSPRIASGNELLSAAAAAAAAGSADPALSSPPGGAPDVGDAAGGGDADDGGWGSDDDDDSFAEDWDAEIAAEEAAAVGDGTSPLATSGEQLSSSIGVASPIQIQRAASDSNVVAGARHGSHGKGIREVRCCVGVVGWLQWHVRGLAVGWPCLGGAKLTRCGCGCVCVLVPSPCVNDGPPRPAHERCRRTASHCWSSCGGRRATASRMGACPSTRGPHTRPPVLRGSSETRYRQSELLLRAPPMLWIAAHLSDACLCRASVVQDGRCGRRLRCSRVASADGPQHCHAARLWRA